MTNLNVQRVVFGEKMSAASVETVNAFKQTFQQMIDKNGLTRDRVYNNEILTESRTVFSLESENDINEWLQCDSTEVGYQLLTDEEIVKVADKDDSCDFEADIEYDGGEIADVMVANTDSRKAAKEATTNMENFIDWYVQQEDANPTDTMILRRLRNFAHKKSETTVKQTKVSEFFKKLNIE